MPPALRHNEALDLTPIGWQSGCGVPGVHVLAKGLHVLALQLSAATCLLPWQLWSEAHMRAVYQ